MIEVKIRGNELLIVTHISTFVAPLSPDQISIYEAALREEMGRLDLAASEKDYAMKGWDR